jgi:hypothetical protein
LPHENNLIHFIEIGIGGTIKIKNGVTGYNLTKTINFIELVGLDRCPGHINYSDKDDRWENRLEAVDLAKRQFNKYNSTPRQTDIENILCLAKEKGWISGYTDGSFHPNEILTKAEALKMILKAFDIKKTPDTPSVDMYEDVEKNAWYYQYIETALSRKLINENPNLEFYQPESPATRGYVAQIIYRVLQS